MYKAYKFRLYPDKIQKEKINSTFVVIGLFITIIYL